MFSPKVSSCMERPLHKPQSSCLLRAPHALAVASSGGGSSPWLIAAWCSSSRTSGCWLLWSITSIDVCGATNMRERQSAAVLIILTTSTRKSYMTSVLGIDSSDRPDVFQQVTRSSRRKKTGEIEGDCSSSIKKSGKALVRGFIASRNFSGSGSRSSLTARRTVFDACSRSGPSGMPVPHPSDIASAVPSLAVPMATLRSGSRCFTIASATCTSL
mmetsp:Transcript_20698/g.63345  ORF Transcript_20698/g.63345 Transcript_20698/m.63345 type:complete len:215 (+) Transcript_20698:293-937(+)